MKQVKDLQERMDEAFDNYFEMSDLLREDLAALLQNQDQRQHWKRNFIRTCAALFEGYTHCLRDICAISFECEAPELPEKEMAALRCEERLAADARIRLTLRAAYRLFELDPLPEFGDQGWSRAQRIFQKRHLLMHPKTPQDLVVEDEHWVQMHYGASWLLRQFTQFFVLLQGKIAVNKT